MSEEESISHSNQSNKLAQMIVREYVIYYQNWGNYIDQWGFDSDSGEALEEVLKRLYEEAKDYPS